LRYARASAATGIRYSRVPGTIRCVVGGIYSAAGFSSVPYIGACKINYDISKTMAIAMIVVVTAMVMTTSILRT